MNALVVALSAVLFLMLTLRLLGKRPAKVELKEAAS